MRALTSDQMAAIVDLVTKHCNAYAVILFGSAAKESLREDSDVDIAYLSKEKMGAYERFMEAQRISNVLKREVDLIDFSEASTVFQTQIVANGILLHDSEPYLRQQEFMVALKSYALLNEERAEILKTLE